MNKTMVANGTPDLRRYYEELKGVEHAKNQLIEDLLQRLDLLAQEHQQEKLDHARESHFNREVQRREMKLQEDLRTISAKMDRDAFILVLIDGDGMIFDDWLLQKGEEGGKEAAGLLYAKVRDHVNKNIPELPSDYKIVAKIYANVRGLADACSRAGIVDSPAIVEEFTRGFTGNKHLFDFVDVGMGKDRADDKISEQFKLHFYNCHCRHIIFGCSHDNGYARLLEEVADPAVPNQITLLEGVPFERELATLRGKFESTKFDPLFRTAKINIYQQQHQPVHQNRPSLMPQPQSMPQSIPMQLPTSNAIQNGLHGSNMGYQSPYYPPPATRSPSQSTNNSVVMNPMTPSWAIKAISAPPVQFGSPPSTPQPTPSNMNSVPRNKYGQRIDSVVSYDKSEVKRVQKIHMCNVHFLRNDCPYGDDCSHSHSYKPNKNELLTLRCVARQTPCHFGTACDDVKCIYGHRCPFSYEGTQECRFGENCRFDKTMHGLDTKVVRTTKVS